MAWPTKHIQPTASPLLEYDSIVTETTAESISTYTQPADRNPWGAVFLLGDIWPGTAEVSHT